MARGDGQTKAKLRGHGFEPSVCEGCPLQKQKGVKGVTVGTCGICGCPTRRKLLLDKFQSPPEGCIRLDQHARQSGNPQNVSGSGSGTDDYGNGTWG